MSSLKNISTIKTDIIDSPNSTHLCDDGVHLNPKGIAKLVSCYKSTTNPLLGVPGLPPKKTSRDYHGLARKSSQHKKELSPSPQLSSPEANGGQKQSTQGLEKKQLINLLCELLS